MTKRQIKEERESKQEKKIFATTIGRGRAKVRKGGAEGKFGRTLEAVMFSGER